MMARWSKIGEVSILFVLILFIFSRVFDAPIRYYLDNAGLIPLVYLPNLFMLGFMALAFCKLPLTMRIQRPVLSVTVIFVYAAIIGCMFIGNIIQILSGFYVLLPFFWGVFSWKVFDKNFERLKPFFLLFWVITVSGIFLSLYVSFPWIGLSYDLFGSETEASRDWSTFGISRVAGFSRSSFDAASQVLILGIMLTVLFKSRIIKICLLFITGIAIVITTTKGIFAAYLIVTLFILTQRWQKIWTGLAVLLLMIIIALPISTAFMTYDLGLTDILMQFLFCSFEDRLLNTWPDALRLLGEQGSYIFGRGIGGIGSAQRFCEFSIYNPGDNLFIYLYVVFGLGVFIILFIFLHHIIANARARCTSLNMFFFPLSLSVFVFGLTANVVESPIFSFLLGAFLSQKLGRKTVTNRNEIFGVEKHIILAHQ